MKMIAYTAPGAEYPEYLNAQVVDGKVRVIVREAPTVRENGSRICAHPKDRGPGRCVPGEETCNNYCNMAPDKGPMADRPAPCRQVFEGKTLEIDIPLSEWQRMMEDAS